MNKIVSYFLANILLRNLLAVMLDFTLISIVFYITYVILITQVKNLNWGVVVSAYILVFLIHLLSLRLRVTRCCPQCYENRAIRISSIPTGNTANFRNYVEGDYWMYSQDEEYLESSLCIYCGYTAENLYWKEKVWRGDLTEEAKQRKQEEANQRMVEQSKWAYKQAILDAHEEMRRRRY